MDKEDPFHPKPIATMWPSKTAYTTMWTVLCPRCARYIEVEGTPLYRENVYPYRQSCHGCGKCLVRPKTPTWCELYTDPSRIQVKV